jgi:hypothetical protein
MSRWARELARAASYAPGPSAPSVDSIEKEPPHPLRAKARRELPLAAPCPGAAPRHRAGRELPLARPCPEAAATP